MSLTPDLKILKDQELDYVPSSETKELLAQKTVIAFVAPTAVGKSTIIQRVVERGGSDFSESYSVVTRPRRADDPAGYKTQTEGYTIEKVTQMIHDNQMTHYVINSDNIYGSLPSSFPAQYNLLPCVPHILGMVSRAGFKAVHILYIVCSVQQWSQQLTERQNLPTYGARLHEAVQSLEWALDHRDTVSFVTNKARELDQTADIVIDLIEGETPGLNTDMGVSLAQAMLEFARDELHRLENPS
jgi:hypothetical protein